LALTYLADKERRPSGGLFLTRPLQHESNTTDTRTIDNRYIELSIKRDTPAGGVAVSWLPTTCSQLLI
jgi:hypothetical protein